MKKTATLFFLLAVTAHAIAQGVFSNQTNGALEKVIRDYPNQFKNIKGELLPSAAASTEYRSTVVIPGAESATIIQHTDADKHNVSWQAVLFASGNFDDAREKYKELFGQIKNTIVKLEGERPVILNGQYESPAEEKHENNLVFDLLPATGSTQQMKVSLSLLKTSQRWKVVLSVYDKDRREDLASLTN
jgi:hypothetical protein